MSDVAKEAVLEILAKLILAIGIFFLNAGIVFWCINALPIQFTISYGQSICLYVLCSVLFKDSGFRIKANNE